MSRAAAKTSSNPARQALVLSPPPPSTLLLVLSMPVHLLTVKLVLKNAPQAHWNLPAAHSHPLLCIAIIYARHVRSHALRCRNRKRTRQHHEVCKDLPHVSTTSRRETRSALPTNERGSEEPTPPKTKEWLLLCDLTRHDAATACGQDNTTRTIEGM
jgi:hypothetical protein